MTDESRISEPVFPISVKYGDTQVGIYRSVEELQCNLEAFDSEKQDFDYDVRDALGRRVSLRINEHLELENLSLTASSQVRND